MKILFLTRFYWSHVGGVERHVEELSLSLSKKRHKVTVFTTRHKSSLFYGESIHGINIIRFDQPKIKYLGLLYIWYWMIKNINLFKKSDIVHIHDVFIWYWPIKLLLPFKKVFVTFHGPWGEYPLSKIDILQKRIAVLLSSGNISIGKYIPKHYGIKSDQISYGATTAMLKGAVSKDKKTVLYVGRLDKELPVKNIFKVFEKLKKTAKFNIEFCGDGEQAAEAKLYGNVRGFVNPVKYYRKARFVFASGYLTIIEALVNKCLVFVSYDNLLQKDYYNMTPFRKFIVCDSDPEKLFRRFKYFETHPREADKLIEIGYQWAKDQTWDKVALLYLKLWIK